MSIRIERINPKNEEQVKLVNEIATYSFHPSPNKDELQKRLDVARFREESDQFLLFEDEKAVASATIHPLTQHIRGKIVKVGGVATVGSLPHARRKGYVSKLMQALFEQMQLNGQAFALLHPFRESFYNRYGYMSLRDRISLKIETNSLRSVTKLQFNTRVEFLKLNDHIDEVIEFIALVQQNQPGMIQFTAKKFEQITTEEFWLAKIYDEDEVVAMVIYQIEGYEISLTVEMFLYTTSTGKFAGLQFLSNHIDHVKTIDMSVRYDDHFDQWLHDLEYKTQRHPGAMLRVVSVEQLTELQLGVGRGEVMINIIDHQIVKNNGGFLLRSDNGTLVIEKVDTAEGKMDITAITAMIAGYYSLDDFEVKGLLEVSKEQKQELEQLFSKVAHEVITYF